MLLRQMNNCHMTLARHYLLSQKLINYHYSSIKS